MAQNCSIIITWPHLEFCHLNDFSSTQLKTLYVTLMFDLVISKSYQEGRIPALLSHIELFSTSASLKSGFCCWISQFPGGGNKSLKRKVFFLGRPPKMMARIISWYHTPNYDLSVTVIELWHSCHIYVTYISHAISHICMSHRNICTLMCVWHLCVYMPYIYDNYDSSMSYSHTDTHRHTHTHSFQDKINTQWTARFRRVQSGQFWHMYISVKFTIKVMNSSLTPKNFLLFLGNFSPILLSTPFPGLSWICFLSLYSLPFPRN